MSKSLERKDEVEQLPAWPRVPLLGWSRVIRTAVCVSIGFVLLILPHLVWLLVKGRVPSPITRIYMGLVAWGMGLSVTVRGEPLAPRALIIANHISWTDIMVIAARTRTAFVARADVRDWPGMGFLARLGSTIFVDRASRRSAPRQVAEIEQSLKVGRVVLFPEGTTGSGKELLPFRPALLDGAADTIVQPVALRYRPHGRDHWIEGELGAFAWDGDKAFTPHLLAVIASGGARAEIIVLPPLAAEDRKQRASEARALTQSTLAKF